MEFLATVVEIPREELIQLGKGFNGIYLEHEGNGYVFERESGAYIGSTIERVREDIRKCPSIAMMIQQVMEAKEYG